MVLMVHPAVEARNLLDRFAKGCCICCDDGCASCNGTPTEMLQHKPDYIAIIQMDPLYRCYRSLCLLGASAYLDGLNADMAV